MPGADYMPDVNTKEAGNEAKKKRAKFSVYNNRPTMNTNDSIRYIMRKPTATAHWSRMKIRESIGPIAATLPIGASPPL